VFYIDILSELPVTSVGVKGGK